MSVEAARARVDELAERYGLSARQAERLVRVLSVLDADESAPTAVRRAEQAVDAHLADSLVALELPCVRSARLIADVGSGVGFPGLALALALGRSEVWLVESQGRRCAFLRGVLAKVGVGNARVVCVRAEQWGEGAGRHDLVVARAVAAQPVVLEYAAPLLRLGGTLVDWRGRRAREEEQQAARASGELGLRPLEVRRVEPFAGARDRHLHVFVKHANTPGRFPRRAGMAGKRPLGRRTGAISAASPDAISAASPDAISAASSTRDRLCGDSGGASDRDRR